MKFDRFIEDGKCTPIEFIETTPVKDGVSCDVYCFTGDKTRDLGIISISAGIPTPKQRVLLGEKTVEGFMFGRGTLTIESTDGAIATHHFKEGEASHPITIEVGQTMQWQADKYSQLTIYEVCEPPFEPGRFENLPD